MSEQADFYRFEHIRDRDGEVNRYHRQFVDERDFQVNPLLLRQLRLDTCRETTPEGRALWLYVRLCQLLCYDEGYYFHDSRKHPNDDPHTSFGIVEQVTATTPVTCFNFSRIAVKLLNQIAGVHALMISVGDNLGHFRFGYYTDKVSVDAEPTIPHEHYNDMARVKLGLKPRGLIVYNGLEQMQELARRIMPPLLATAQQNLPPYLTVREGTALHPAVQPISLHHLVADLKAANVDGATLTQVLFDLNKKIGQPPYHFVRSAWLATTGELQPQLLVRKQQSMVLIDLNRMAVTPFVAADYHAAVQQGRLLFIEDDAARQTAFSRGMEL